MQGRVWSGSARATSCCCANGEDLEAAMRVLVTWDPSAGGTEGSARVLGHALRGAVAAAGCAPSGAGGAGSLQAGGEGLGARGLVVAAGAGTQTGGQRASERGAVAMVQDFGSHLQVTPHLHVLVAEAVWDAGGASRLRPKPLAEILKGPRFQGTSAARRRHRRRRSPRRRERTPATARPAGARGAAGEPGRARRAAETA